jgi:hypothetical protein
MQLEELCLWIQIDRLVEQRILMNNLQRMGAVSALGAAATFIVGFWLYFTLLTPAGYGSLRIDPVKHAAFLVDNRSTMYAWNFIIYIFFGGLLVVLALALYERMKGGAPALMRSATAFALIWATLVIASGMVANIGADVIAAVYGTNPVQAAAAWLSLSMVVNGLGGGNEVVGGMWVGLVSVAALRTNGFPKPLSYFGMIISIAGLLTTIPPLKELGAVFGLGLIVWLASLGFILLKSRQAIEVRSGASC